MGTDKALLADRTGLTLLERAARVLEQVSDELLLAVGPEPRYADHLGAGRRAVLDRSGAGDGPLAGLSAALGAADGAWVVAAPVDMPGLNPELFDRLLARAREDGSDLCLALGPRGPEPLLGAFGPRCAARADELLETGERRPLALADPGGGLRASLLELGDEESERCLTNLNTPEDWRGGIPVEQPGRRAEETGS